MRREGVLQPFFVPTRWDPNTCSCGCPKQEFGEEEEACQEGGEGHWDQSTCQCHPRRMRVSERGVSNLFQVAERGVEAQQQYNPCTDLSRMHYSPRLPPPDNMVLSTLSNSGCTTAAWTLLDGFFLGLASLSSSYSGAPHGTTGGQITLFSMRFLLQLVPFPKLP